MATVVNYAVVVMIWATTPLAIKISSASLTPYAALWLRIALAVAVLFAVVRLFDKGALLKKQHIPVYVMGSLALFPNMQLVYQASQYITSGMIAVLFALTPISNGVIGGIVFKEKVFTPSRLVALALGLMGVVIIFSEQLQIGEGGWVGLGLMLLSCICFSLSQIGVKYLQKDMQVKASEQTLGAMVFSLPGLTVAWLMMDGELPALAMNEGLMAIIYLGLVGSLVGFIAYYMLLTKVSLAAISMVPLMSPVLALWLGYLLLDEQATVMLIVGTLCIVMGLACYDNALIKLLSPRHKKRPV